MNDARMIGAICALLVAVGCGGEVRDRSTGSERGAAGAAGACTPLPELTNLSPTPLPAGDAYSGVLSDGRYVYFSGVSTLYRVPVSGGPTETVYAGPLGFYAAGGGVVAWVTLAPDTNDPVGLTIDNVSGSQDVVLPAGVRPSPASNIVADAAGNVFFDVDLPTGSSATWRWNPATNSAAPMPGVGSPDGPGANLYWADRGQVVWAGDGLYATDMSTGTQRQLVADNSVGFGSLLGLDAENIYGAGDICPKSACTFTVYGVARAGGLPFVAFQSVEPSWTVGLQADDSGLYWIDWESLGIFHAPLSPSGPAEHVVDPGSGIGEFATDACNLYWLQVDSTQTTRLMGSAK